MSKKIITHNNGIVETRETFYTEKTIQQLKQQLEEKDKEINQLKQEKKNAGEEKARAYLDTLTKPKIIELCLQYINDKNIAEQQLEALMLEISKQEVEQHDLPDYCTRTGTDCTNLGKIEELQQQLAEKEKENEELKLKLDIRAMNLQNINTERMEAVRNQTQLAIQELEKVHAVLVSKAREVVGTGVVAVRLYTINEVIDQQIKELKGENK